MAHIIWELTLSKWSFWQEDEIISLCPVPLRERSSQSKLTNGNNSIDTPVKSEKMDQLNDNYWTTRQPSKFNIVLMPFTNCVWIGEAFMFWILPFYNITIFAAVFCFINSFIIFGSNLDIDKVCFNPYNINLRDRKNFSKFLVAKKSFIYRLY